MWIGSLALLCILVLNGFPPTAHAARTPEHRREFANPNIFLPPGSWDNAAGDPLPEARGAHKFTLRHVYHHGSHLYPELHRFRDVSPHTKLQVSEDYGETVEDAPEALVVLSQSMVIQRLARRTHSDIDQLLEYAYHNGHPAELSASAWTEDEISGPNITDKETVLSFARMASNAYILSPADGEWLPVKGGFNYTDDFGWEADGLRGHIFADETNKTIVIGLKGTSTWLDNLWLPWPWLGRNAHAESHKGTSPAVFDGSDTTGNDKFNDNLFGSCCCARGGPIAWKAVCDCMTGTYTCNSTCLVRELREKGHYYRAVKELFSNVTERYPDSDVWLAGHSLGGVVSSLLGLTYGLPTMTYEAFPDAMAAKRLGLPTPPGYKIGAHQARPRTGIHHFGHTADPIFMGSCRGSLSFCSIAGYAFEGWCHTGQTCIYDTVNDLGWRVGIGTHKIVSVIRDVLEKYDTVPGCEADVDCLDCPLWKFYENNGTDTTTTTRKPTSTSHTFTRTETCKTPGWWGCLDETTTSAKPSTSSTTVTCQTPGWFGCKDQITTTTIITSKSHSATPSTISTTSCETPGWFGGCNDIVKTTSATAKPSPIVTTTVATRTGTATNTDTCTSREWFGLICVDPSPTSTSSTSAPTTKLPSGRRKHCVSRNWYGSCREWDWSGITLDRKADL